jgi:uncharacterized protein with PhoU and TrkA domain
MGGFESSIYGVLTEILKEMKKTNELLVDINYSVRCIR